METTMEQVVVESYEKAYNQGLDHSIEIIRQYKNNSPLIEAIIKHIEGLKEYQSNVNQTIQESLKPFMP